MFKYLNSRVRGPVNTVKNSICQLKPIEADQDIITLHDGINVVGRSKETGIRDGLCSKNQIELNVNFKSGQIQLKALGLNPCCVNGLMTLKDSVCDLQDGDMIEVVYGRLPFELIFKPENEMDNKSIEHQKEERRSSDANSTETWTFVENETMAILTSVGVVSSEKIAGYDLDNTIIKTKSGNVFPKNTSDWEIAYTEVPNKLKRLHQDGFKICFFTNQGGIAKGKVNMNEFKDKLRFIIKRLGVPVQVFIAIKNGYFRKPLPGMWEHLQNNMNDSIKLNSTKCFFVGDAAGRPAVNKRRKDHSLADRLFADNIGIAFYTPEEHFLNRKTEEWCKPEFQPNNVHDNLSLLEPPDTKIPAEQIEMIVMVGLPGSGKSHFCQHHLSKAGYVVINADTLGSTQACVKACEKALKSGNSCVVDNTNVDAESRNKFIRVAERLNVGCRCFIMKVTLAQTKHNIAFRELTDTSHSKINEMVLNIMKKKYKEAAIEEGFSEIVKVNNILAFNCSQHEKLYRLYLVEK